MSACDCCARPVSPPPEIHLRVSCGFGPFPGGGKWYSAYEYDNALTVGPVLSGEVNQYTRFGTSTYRLTDSLGCVVEQISYADEDCHVIEGEVTGDCTGAALNYITNFTQSDPKDPAKWRIEHSPTATCYLKVWLVERLTAAYGGTTRPLEPYVWEGEGNPCAPDPALSPVFQTIVSEETAITAVDVEQIEVLKYSYLPDYTPPDDGSANGYPP